MRLGLPTPTPQLKRGLWKVLGYEPNPIQAAAHLSPARTVVVSGGVRSGKSFSAAREALAWLFCGPCLVWLVGPSYQFVRAEFEYLANDAVRLGLCRKRDIRMPANEYIPPSLRTVLGGTVAARSTEDVRKLAAEAPDLVVLCEPGMMPEQAYAKARERVSQRRGRIWLAGTIEDAYSWYADLVRRGQAYPNPDDVQSFVMPTWANRAIFPQGLDDPYLRAEREADEEWFRERYGGEPMAPRDLVLRGLDLARVVADRDYDPGLPVEVAIDPGWRRGHGYAVLAVQSDGYRAWVIDEVYVEEAPLPAVLDICRRWPWWGSVRQGVIDRAGAQHHGGLTSQVEAWWAEGVHLSYAAVPEDDGIQKLRWLLSEGRVTVHPRCRRLLWEMAHWRYRRLQDGHSVSEKPLDRDCDCVKALIYWCWQRLTLYEPLGSARPYLLGGGADEQELLRETIISWR